MFCEPFAAVVPYFFRLTLGFVNFCEQYQIHWPDTKYTVPSTKYTGQIPNTLAQIPNTPSTELSSCENPDDDDQWCRSGKGQERVNFIIFANQLLFLHICNSTQYQPPSAH